MSTAAHWSFLSYYENVADGSLTRLCVHLHGKEGITL